MIKLHLKKLAALCLTSVMGMSLLAGCGKKEEENKIKEMRDLTGTRLESGQHPGCHRRYQE